MNKIYHLIIIKICQFFLVLALFFHVGTSVADRESFVCGYKNVIHYLNSLITYDREIALRYIKALKVGVITRVELRKLVSILMRYRLLPLNQEKKCRFYNYLCVSVTAHEGKTLDSYVDDYLQRFPGGPQDCYVYSSNKQIKVSIFSEDCRIAIDYRIRPIPFPLALTQAGFESAWGTSRFSTEGNNFFGTQTRGVRYPSKCQTPRRDLSRCVYRFGFIETSFYIYAQSLNSLRAYSRFRDIRYESELNSDPICETAEKVAEGLSNYAEDPQYVEKLKRTVKTVCQIIDSC